MSNPTSNERLLKIALRSLVDAVAYMKVPQTLEDAALQITVTLGPALRAAQDALASVSGDSSAPETPKPSKQIAIRHAQFLRRYLLRQGCEFAQTPDEIALFEVATFLESLPDETRAQWPCSCGHVNTTPKLFTDRCSHCGEHRGSVVETGPKRLMTHGDNPISGGLMECKSEKATPKCAIDKTCLEYPRCRCGSSPKISATCFDCEMARRSGQLECAQHQKASDVANPADFPGGPLEYPEDFDPQ